MPTSHTFRRAAALTTGAALFAGCLTVLPAAGSAEAAERSVTLTPNPAYTGDEFEGWGTSLVWFANATGGYPEELREQLYQAVFGDDGLDLNIARYNIGGGNASDVDDYLRAGGAVDGWWAADPDGSTGTYGGAATTYAERDTILAEFDADDPSHYDLSADETQRWWVDRLVADDRITHWETFANSAPYFMTESGYVSGGFDAGDEQLKPEADEAFARYLVNVTERLEAEHGIQVETIDPFNEPNTNYWGTQLADGVPVGGRQEGMHVGPERQVDVVGALAGALDGAATDARIAAMDETNPGLFATNWAAYPAEARDEVARMNVHTYGTDGRLVVRDLAKQADTPLWMSEIEGSWVDGYDPVNIENGLGIAGRIMDDLRELEPSAWVLWQPVEDLYNMQPQGEDLNWGSVFIDLDCEPYDEGGETVWKSARRVSDAGGDPSAVEPCGVETNSKFHTIRNFTKFIREGDRLIPIDDTSSTAAVRGDGTGATIVHRNKSTDESSITLDLSGFGEIADGATVTPVVTTQAPSADDPAANALVEGSPTAIDRGSASATLTVPAKSVTTFVIDGVAGVSDDAPAIEDGRSYQFVGAQSGKALTAGGDGAATSISDPTEETAAASAQKWTAHEVPAGERAATRRVVLENGDGRILGATSEGTDLREVSPEAASADPATRWIVNTTDGRTFTLVNESLALALEVGGASTADGASVGVYGSNGGANQAWEARDLTPVDGSAVAARTTAGVAPDLPDTVLAQYAWGTGAAVPVEWDMPDETAWDSAGRVEVPGAAVDPYGQEFAVVAHVDVGGLTATDPVSITVAEGAGLDAVRAQAPDEVPARVGASEHAFGVPVEWDWSSLDEAALGSVGEVSVTGVAYADGGDLDARLTVLVTTSTLRSFAADGGVAVEASYAEPGYPAERTLNGVLDDKGWSNWSGGAQESTSTLTYTFEARELAQAAIRFWRDGRASWAETMALELRDADGAWSAAPGWEDPQAVDSPSVGAPTVTAEFPAMMATGVRFVMHAAEGMHMIVSEVELFEPVASPAATASLADLRVAGETVAGFSPDETSYEVTVGAADAPVVQAFPVDDEASVAVEQPSEENGWTARVSAVSADGSETSTTTVTVSVGADPSITTTTSHRCLGPNGVLTVTATNAGDAPADIEVSTAYGERTFDDIEPGDSASTAFRTRMSETPAGEAEILATARVDGEPVTDRSTAPYGAFACE
ncbi:RICIN domain-containing protein [Microbacterium karelineae]|uniref:RICIN domain-containing protein n=1 Tax=Microbacterium karelineae TaxID=2654283 RepID=UPI0012E9D6B4|nr:glycoside hydrolase [Microbacterium karelineae]